MIVFSFITSRFENWVLEAREPLKQYKRQADEATTASRKKKGGDEHSYLMLWLHQYLSDRRRPNRQDSGYIWDYEIYAINHAKVKVCKNVFCAIMGISRSEIDWAQRRVNNNMNTESLVENAYKDKEKITLESALREFHIDCDEEYRNHIDLFVNVEKIPESNRALVCVAFLCEFFNLCGDHEV